MKLRLFNPGCELEVANGSPYFQLPKYPAMIEEDLAVLPMFFSNNGDYVVVNKIPNEDFISFWKQYYNVCFVNSESCNSLNDFRFEGFAPWGISPRALYIAEKFKANFADNYNFGFLKQQNMLFNRKSSAELLRIFVGKINNSDIYPTHSSCLLWLKTQNKL